MSTATLTKPNPALERGGFHTELKAEATLLDGLTVDSDFDPLIRKYYATETRLWPMIKKVSAKADTVRDIVEATRPAAGFFNKTNMDLTENPTTAAAKDLTDPGQEVKALGGVIECGHYAQSLQVQQGNPYGNDLSDKTEGLVQETMITLERTLFNGDSSVPGRENEFNGLAAQMRATNAYTADITAGESATAKIREVVRRAMSTAQNGQEIRIKPTAIFTSNLGCEILEEEAENKLQYENLGEITPGVQVPMIRTQAGLIPVIDSIWITDEPAGPGTGEVSYWILDLARIVWHGVIPLGAPRTGANRFDPKVFQLSDRVNPTLAKKRVVIQYGTLKVDAYGLGAWKVTVTVDGNRL